MLKFKDDMSMYVAVRHAMHSLPVFADKTRQDVFDGHYVQRPREEDKRAQRTTTVAQVAEITATHMGRFETSVAALAEQVQTGAFDAPPLAVMEFQRIQVATMTGLWESLAPLGAEDEETRTLLVQYVARVQAFNPTQFIAESADKRSADLAALAETTPTLATWATVFRDDEIREKNVKVLLREATAYDEAYAVVESDADTIAELASTGEEYPADRLDQMVNLTTDRALGRYAQEVLVPRMIGLVNTYLVPNEDSVALSAKAPAVAERSMSRIYNKVSEEIRNELVVPMVKDEYDKRARMMEE